jgi:hypothetical protein
VRQHRFFLNEWLHLFCCEVDRGALGLQLQCVGKAPIAPRYRSTIILKGKTLRPRIKRIAPEGANLNTLVPGFNGDAIGLAICGLGVVAWRPEIAKLAVQSRNSCYEYLAVKVFD